VLSLRFSVCFRASGLARGVVRLGCVVTCIHGCRFPGVVQGARPRLYGWVNSKDIHELLAMSPIDASAAKKRARTQRTSLIPNVLDTTHLRGMM
jgi:hypothetical protein